MTDTKVNEVNAVSPNEAAAQDGMDDAPVKSIRRLLLENPYIFGVTAFSSLGGFLFGYDQGAISEVLTMESFGARFPRIYLDSGFEGWFVSTLLLSAWFGSLLNGPAADRWGRKFAMEIAVCIFTVGSTLQAAAMTIPMLFAGRAIAGLAVGMLTTIVPMYMAEVSLPRVRGTLIVLQQLSITLGILLSYWIEYGTHFIGGTRCDPSIPYSGGTASDRTFDPRHDVGPDGCTGQSEVSWRLPFALQIVPALILGIGMFMFPESPRWMLMRGRDEDAMVALSKLRRLDRENGLLKQEYLDIKTEVLFEQTHIKELHGNMSGVKLEVAQYVSLVNTWPNFRRLAIGCCIMFFQQFMGCNAIIYYAPTIFGQLGLSGNTSSLLATGVYGIVNTLSTLPALFLIDKVGRRVLLMCGSIGTCISLVIVGAIIGKYGSDLVDHKTAGWVGIAFVYIYDINFSYSFELILIEPFLRIIAPIGWVLPSEIFNLSIRSKAMSITTSATWMCNFIIGLVTPDMLSSIEWGTYIFFAAFCLLALGFTVFFVPETRGRSLEDMDVVFGDTAAVEEKARMRAIEEELRGKTEGMKGVEKMEVERTV
ncbi:MAG: hypothetical protein M1834_004179 [Cirrosporium novae-zelandiae]|nr:MAG: hypothetical protein M1834_004179 [Cirrosporium novae-zelandiae]